MAAEKVIFQPPPEHWCGPNESGMWLGHDWEPEGTVIECEECGRTYVSRGQIYANWFTSAWRRERRFERWLRLRRANAANG